MEIRLIGTPEELEKALNALDKLFDFTYDGSTYSSKKPGQYRAYLNDVTPKN